jgi:UDP-glucuronate decarboxylase
VVAGGAGFLGSHLCEALLGLGARVWCVDNLQTGQQRTLRAMEQDPRFTFIEADVIETAFKARLPRRIDMVFNLACAASPVQYQADPEHTMLTSVVGTRNLLRVAEAAGARFLLTSTSEVYGDPEVHPQTESYRGNVNCTGPRACYDEGKRAAESLALDFDRAGRAAVRVARLFNTYGPRMRADDGRVVSNVVTQALDGAEITVYGDGSQTRSFCYVDDTIDGLLRLMAFDGGQPGPVNIGNPVELTVSDLVGRVLALTGSPSPVVHLPLPEDDPRRRRPDITRAKQLLGWVPRRDLHEGLRATIEWFREVQSDPEHRELTVAGVHPG